MRKITGILGITAALLTGCSSTPVEAPEEQASKVLFHGGIEVEESHVWRDENGGCRASVMFVSEDINGLAGSQVIIRDSNDQIVATPTVEVSSTEKGCAWIFEEEIDQHSDFYRAEFLDFTTEIMPVSEAENGVITFDIQTPITERAESELKESWDISPLDSFRGD